MSEPLPYESRVQGALAEGETLLWESPATNQRKPPILRVTDQRILLENHGERSAGEILADDLAGFVIKSRRSKTTIRFLSRGTEDVIDFAHTELREIEVAVLNLWRHSKRRAKIRRSALAGSAMMHDSISTPSEITLQPGEVVLWTGRPRTWDRVGARWVRGRLKIIAWMIIPAAIIANDQKFFGWRFGNSSTFWLVASMLWLVVSLYALLAQPFFDALRRSRTHYLLTNMRSIVIQSRRARKVHSTFLDLAQNATLLEEPDGTGTIEITGAATLERVANAQDVYTRVLEAIRVSGNTPRPD